MENNTRLQPDGNTQQKTGKSRRGFASMDSQRHKEVSSRGGKSPRLQYNNRSNPSPTPEASENQQFNNQ